MAAYLRVFNRYILDETGTADIFKKDSQQRVFSFPSFSTSSRRPAASSVGADNSLEAEIKVFNAAKAAADNIAANRPNMKFLVFHSVYYGLSGDVKWESDVDVLLLCFDEAKGNLLGATCYC
jgi:hypothetical protein